MNIIDTEATLAIDQQTPILEARDLKLSRDGAGVLDVACLKIKESEVLALIGPNGAGKTTLLVVLCHLVKSFQGSLFFKGRRVGEEMPVNEYRRKIAMVFQEPLLFSSTVFDNVAAGLNYRRVKRYDVEKVVYENLERLGIFHLRDRSARTLSGGEAQRVSLARAFAINPDILFLDEPFSALDPPTRESLVSDFEEVLKQSKTTAIFATHDRMEALRIADRIAVMNNGKILQMGIPEDVMNHPDDEFVASFVGVESILKGRVLESRDGEIVVSVDGHEIEVVGNNPPGEHVILCIRPENVTLSGNSSGAQTSARNVFPGVIEKTALLGLYYRVDIDCGFPLVAYVTKHSLNDMALSAGNTINVSFKATAVHVLKAKSK